MYTLPWRLRSLTPGNLGTLMIRGSPSSSCSCQRESGLEWRWRRTWQVVWPRPGPLPPSPGPPPGARPAWCSCSPPPPPPPSSSSCANGRRSRWGKRARWWQGAARRRWSSRCKPDQLKTPSSKFLSTFHPSIAPTSKLTQSSNFNKVTLY